MDVVETAEDAAGLELPPLVVREPLEAFLDAHGIGEGRLEAERIGEGHSNITFLVKRGDARVVLRRPPRPPLPPSAHDVLREARLLKALEGTPVRVPTVIAVGDDETVLGVPFYVMEEIHGSVLASAIPPAIDTADERRRTAEELVDALVELHNVDWRACGLEGYGKPTGYLERQVRRFSGLWEHNKTRELPVVEELGEWLGRNMPESPESTIVHGDYRLGNVMMADAAPAELVAIFDWELSTIGDPLADVGYLTVTWVEPDDPQDTMFANLNAVTRSGGFLTREEIIARYEERSGRSMSALNWYQALALWKAAVFMEGNYKRFQAGNSDDEYLGLFDRGRADAGREGQGDRALVKGLLVDFGGVLTTNVFDSFRAFCDDEGLDPDTIKGLFREDPRALECVRGLERGELTEEQFAERFGELLELEDGRRAGLVDRMFGHIRPDDEMVEALRRARAHGIRTGLISNSMGAGRYDRSTFPELFDGVVISGDEGMHKPEPEIYELGCERVGLAPAECVFVDDLRENCEGAEAVGMTAVLHRGAERTLPQLEDLLGVELR